MVNLACTHEGSIHFKPVYTTHWSFGSSQIRLAGKPARHSKNITELPFDIPAVSSRHAIAIWCDWSGSRHVYSGVA